MKIIDEVDKKDLVDERSTAVSEKEDLYVIESGGRQRFVYQLNDELSGRNFHLIMDTGYEYVIHFLNGETLAWARQGDPFVYENYKCAKGNPQTYLVSFVSGEESAPTCITVVIDLENNLVTMVKANKGVYPARNRLTTHQIIFGAIKIPGESLPIVRHGYTAELVGKKIAWKYSPSVKLTHIYISERYMRGSLKDMPPIDENTTDAQKEEIEDRAKRWNELFFEEPCFYIKISKHLYLVGILEDFRNRINPQTGGGELLLLIDTVLMRDVVRSFDMQSGQAPEIHLSSAFGEFIDAPDEMEVLPSPYRLE